MKLVAGLMVAEGEIKRYLKPCIQNLQRFCDEIVVHDEGDNNWLSSQKKVFHHPVEPGTFFAHEGMARQALFENTLMAEPTHVLAIDADEFISDGPALRKHLEENPEVLGWGLCMEEVWGADDKQLYVRMDGGWFPHLIACLYQPKRGRLRQGDRHWNFPDRRLACGRVPPGVGRLGMRDMDLSVLHFGWANRTERVKRFARYEKHDQGNFHAQAHLDSIMWSDQQVTLATMSWAEALLTEKSAILKAAGYKPTKG